MKHSYRRRHATSRLERLLARIVTIPRSTQLVPRIDLARDAEVEVDLA